jgi:hypothetical protein
MLKSTIPLRISQGPVVITLQRSTTLNGLRIRCISRKLRLFATMRVGFMVTFMTNVKVNVWGVQIYSVEGFATRMDADRHVQRIPHYCLPPYQSVYIT